ncbi:MAG TPA: polysaccharide deacetylase family protein [Acidimicrobiales bacterium]|nr:polysaccharide deacetylase family protein [Acidimicrobiales bacterium]
MSVSRRTFITGAAAAFLAACGRGRKTPAASRASTTTVASSGAGGSDATTTTVGGPARYVPHGPRDGTAVALTFHGSGDHSLGLQLLDAAAKARAPITVFAVGTWLEQEPDMARRILDAGHELANHTYTHPSLGRVDRAGVASEITRCRDVLARVSGSGGRWFRPSGIDVPTALMLEETANAGYHVSVGYDLDPHDYQDPGAAAVLSRVKASVQPGSIISLHFGHAGTVAAFPGIVSAIRDRGLEPVLVRQLLTA